VTPLKRKVWFREGPGIMADEFRDEGTPLLRITNIRSGCLSLDGCNFVDPAKALGKWAHFGVKPGELLISGSASGGLAVTVPPEALGAIPYTGLIRVRPLREDDLDTGYLRHFLLSRTFLDQMDMLKTGVAIQHWGPYHLRMATIPIHDPEQQRSLAARMDHCEQSVGDARAAMAEQIKLLRQRKRSLISAAVSGEFDVITASGRSA
jgi:type I restriction enzyme S subunit